MPVFFRELTNCHWLQSLGPTPLCKCEEMSNMSDNIMAFIWSSSPVKSSFMSWLWIIGVAVLPQYGPHPVVMGYFAPCPTFFFFFFHCFYSFHSEAFVTVAGPKKKIILSVLCLKPCLKPDNVTLGVCASLHMDPLQLGPSRPTSTSSTQMDFPLRKSLTN